MPTTAGYDSNGNCEAGYEYTVNVFVCIEDDGTLRVLWETPGNGFNEKITAPAWDGSAKSTNFSDGEVWCQGGGTSESQVSLTATSIGTDAGGSTIVQIDWSIEATNCYTCGRDVSGSYDFVVTKGEGCPS